MRTFDQFKTPKNRMCRLSAAAISISHRLSGGCGKFRGRTANRKSVPRTRQRPFSRRCWFRLVLYCVPADFPHTRIEDNSPCANSLAISRLSGGGLWQKGELTAARTSDSNYRRQLHLSSLMVSNLHRRPVGIAAYENATYREAVEYLERAVSLDPTSTKAHLYLADAYNEGIVRIASSTQGKPPRSMITGVY